ncbi:MAG: hypothetical protein MZW92_75815 [Comamonadaceae bacterium]|nr:hypothetical protein [Comamonadaceae bacterium]
MHGYISFDADRPPARSEFSAGMGFYAAVWPLVGPAAGRFPDRPAQLVDHAGQLRQQGQAARPGGHAGPDSGRSAGRLGAASSRPSKAAWATGPATISATARRSSA